MKHVTMDKPRGYKSMILLIPNDDIRIEHQSTFERRIIESIEAYQSRDDDYDEGYRHYINKGCEPWATSYELVSRSSQLLTKCV